MITMIVPQQHFLFPGPLSFKQNFTQGKNLTCEIRTCFYCFLLGNLSGFRVHSRNVLRIMLLKAYEVFYMLNLAFSKHKRRKAIYFYYDILLLSYSRTYFIENTLEIQWRTNTHDRTCMANKLMGT